MKTISMVPAFVFVLAVAMGWACGPMSKTSRFASNKPSVASPRPTPTITAAPGASQPSPAKPATVLFPVNLTQESPPPADPQKKTIERHTDLSEATLAQLRQGRVAEFPTIHALTAPVVGYLAVTLNLSGIQARADELGQLVSKFDAKVEIKADGKTLSLQIANALSGGEWAVLRDNVVAITLVVAEPQQ